MILLSVLRWMLDSEPNQADILKVMTDSRHSPPVAITAPVN